MWRRLTFLTAVLGVVPAWAGETAEGADAPAKPDASFDWGGHVKMFGLATFPYAIDLPDEPLYDLLNPLPSEPTGQAFLDGRLNLSVDVDTWFHWEAAHAITTSLNADSARDVSNAEIAEPLQGEDALTVLADLARLGGLIDADEATSTGSGASSPFSTGVGLAASEAFPLTWVAWGDTPVDLRVQGRTDRFLFKFSPERMDVTIGRQPVSFGHGMFFTPLDLINPFTPATVDTEYKPGLDAIRVDAYFGMAGQVTGVVAYTGKTYLYEAPAPGESTAERVSAAAYGQTTFGVTDLGLFYGFIKGDHVVGATMVTGVGPVGVTADAAVTVPRPELGEPVFFRGVVGVNGRPTGTTTLAGEVYVQTFGSTDAADLFDTLGSERAARGEVWQAGLVYAALSVSQEITPLLIGCLGAIGNLTDPSVLLTPSVSWSIAGNVDAVFGGYVGLGARPEGRTLDLDNLPDAPTADDLSVLTPRSEFGTYPATVFVQLRAYF